MAGKQLRKVRPADVDVGMLRAAWDGLRDTELAYGVTTHIYLRQEDRKGVFGVRVAAFKYAPNTKPRKVAVVELPYPTAEETTLTGVLLAAITKIQPLVAQWHAVEVAPAPTAAEPPAG